MGRTTWRASGVLGLAACLAACGSATGTSGSSGSSDTTAAITTIDELPRSSDPVVSDTSANVARSVLRSLSTSGLNLSTMSSSSFNTDSSMAMCEMANALKSSFNDAVQGDITLCYVQAINETVGTGGLLGGVDIYDGDPHVFAMTFTGETEEGGGPGENFRVRLQVVKDAAGAISDFKMWACDGDTQTEYLSQGISGGNFTMTSKNLYDNGSESGRQSLTVTGTLNDSQQFTAKTIASDFTHESSYGSGYGEKTVVQTADQATMSSWYSGTHDFEGQDYTHLNTVYGVSELLTPTDISTIAIGHGAAVGAYGGTYPGGTYTDSYEQGWNGDTTVVGSNDFNAVAAAGTQPTVGSVPSIGFSGDEIWDCSGGTEGALPLTVDVGAIQTACESLRMGWDWVNCWELIQPIPE